MKFQEESKVGTKKIINLDEKEMKEKIREANKKIRKNCREIEKENDQAKRDNAHIRYRWKRGSLQLLLSTKWGSFQKLRPSGLQSLNSMIKYNLLLDVL